MTWSHLESTLIFPGALGNWKQNLYDFSHPQDEIVYVQIFL